jgi:imidazolonepropionase-like amidohydrolase
MKHISCNQKNGLWRHIAVASLALAVAACGGGDKKEDKKETGEREAMLSNPFPSTYAPYPSSPTVISNVTILTGTGEKIEDGAIFLRDGVIEAIGKSGEIKVPKGDIVSIDGTGKVVTPGIIDNHSHLGVYPSPGFSSTSDGNEATSPNTAQVWAEHSVWPQDPGFTRALAGGVTSLQILPGSANLFGGRAVTLKNVPARTVQDMKFPDAPYGMKMACGENPKRVYANSGPATRMGNFAGYRKAWIEAAEYKKKWDDYLSGDEDNPPSRDLKKETLAGVLSGEIFVNMHCYRADEMVQVIDMSKEFGYKVAAFHHVVEGYKVADYLAENDICAAVWADWWGFKLEAYDMVPANAVLIDAQENGCAIIHSDSAVGIQRLNQETAKAITAGKQLGFDIPPERAIKWITYNPAKGLGILDKTGTLETGKMADVVLWDGDPFSVYTKAEKVFIDGALMYDALDADNSPRMDFEIGQQDNGVTGGAGQ